MRSAHRGRRNRIVVAESRGGGVRPRGHDGARLRGPEAATSGAGKRGLRSDERPRRGRPRERRESARAGLLSSRRRRGCRFAAVPGHQRLDRPTLGRGDDGRVGDKRSLGRKGDASPGRPAAGCVPAVFLVAGRREGHRAAKFRQRIAPRGSSKCVRPPSFPRIPRAHAEPSDHHHRAKRQEQPGGERRAHEKPHRRDVRRGGDHHRRNRRWLIELGARVGSWELDRRRRGRLRRAGGGPRGRGRRGGRRDRSRPRHRSLVRLQHHIPELQVRTRARDVYPRHSVPGRFSFEQPSPPPRRRVVEKVRIDRDGHRVHVDGDVPELPWSLYPRASAGCDAPARSSRTSSEAREPRALNRRTFQARESMSNVDASASAPHGASCAHIMLSPAASTRPRSLTQSHCEVEGKGGGGGEFGGEGVQLCVLRRGPRGWRERAARTDASVHCGASPGSED